MYKAELAIQQLISGVQLDRQQLDGFIVRISKILTFLKMFTSFKLSTLYRVAEVPEDDKEDFYPSRLLLSATIQVDKGINDQIPTNYHAISRRDEQVTYHPMVVDEGATRNWWESGRVTPGWFRPLTLFY
jgi:hypothetical protein